MKVAAVSRFWFALAVVWMGTSQAHASPEHPVFNLEHADMAKCWAFYSWESSTSDVKHHSDALAKAAARVRARLFREIGQEFGSAMLTTAMHTWNYLSSVVQDSEWERIAKVLHPSCLTYQ